MARGSSPRPPSLLRRKAAAWLHRPPLAAVAVALIVGLALAGLSLGLLLPRPSGNAAGDWARYGGAVQLVRECPDGTAIYRRQDGRWFAWRGGWEERRSLIRRPDAC